MNAQGLLSGPVPTAWRGSRANEASGTRMGNGIDERPSSGREARARGLRAAGERRDHTRPCAATPSYSTRPGPPMMARRWPRHEGAASIQGDIGFAAGRLAGGSGIIEFERALAFWPSRLANPLGCLAGAWQRTGTDRHVGGLGDAATAAPTRPFDAAQFDALRTLQQRRGSPATCGRWRPCSGRCRRPTAGGSGSSC